jgi:hypothetical protein
VDEPRTSRDGDQERQAGKPEQQPHY